MPLKMKQGQQGDGLCRCGCEQQPINQPSFNRATKAPGERSQLGKDTRQREGCSKCIQGKDEHKLCGSRPESVLRIVSDPFLCKIFNCKNLLKEELRHPTSLMFLVDPCLTSVTGQPEYWTGTLGKPGGKVTRWKEIQNPPSSPVHFPPVPVTALPLLPQPRLLRLFSIENMF